MPKSNKSTAKKNSKVTEEEFDDIFDGDEEMDEDDTFEDDDSDDEDEGEFEDDESEDEEDEELEDEEEEDEDFPDEDDLDEDVDDVVETSLQENANGITQEAFEEFRAEVFRRLDGINQLLTTTAKPGTGTSPVQPQKTRTQGDVKKAIAKGVETSGEPKRGRGRPPGSGNKKAAAPVEEKPAKKAAKVDAAPSSSGIKKKDAAVILTAMNQKDDRKGTDAAKFARLLSKKKFEGRVSPDEILSWLKSEKHVFSSGAKENTFKR